MCWTQYLLALKQSSLKVKLWFIELAWDLQCKWSKIFSNFLRRTKWAEKVLGNSFKTWKRIKSRLESFDQLFDIVRWTFLEISQNFIFINSVFHSQLWLQQTIIFIVKSSKKYIFWLVGLLWLVDVQQISI